MKKIQMYPYGFVFSKNMLENAPDNFRKIQVNDDYFFYYDWILEADHKQINGKFIIIYGHYTYAHPEHSFSNQKLIEILFEKYFVDYSEFLNMLDYLGGRYVIIVGDGHNINFYNDAAGTRSIYYSLDNDIVSSHVKLIADNQETSKDNLVAQFKNLPKISTRTPYDNVNGLLPNHTLELNKKEIKRYFPREANPFTHLSTNEKVVLFEKIIRKQLNYYFDNYPNIVHSITGGYDSRLSFAISKEHFDRIRFFTYTLSQQKVKKKNNFSTRYEEDKILVNQLIEHLPIDHTFFYLSDNKKQVSDELNHILASNTIVEHGRKLIPHYLDFSKDDYALHIRGNASAVLKSPYLSLNEERDESFLLKKFISNLRLKKSEEVSKELLTYLKKEIKKYNYDGKVEGYHGLDLAYWEIRTGRFHAEVFNESDVAFDSLNPVNLRVLYCIALSFDLKDRINNYITKELINRNLPILNFYGINQLQNMYEEKQKEESLMELPDFKVPSFSIHDDNDQKIHDVANFNHTLYIPKNYIEAGNYASIQWIFDEEKGFITLDLINAYSVKKGKNYLKYEIYKNEKLVLSEDIAFWQYNNNISIFNLIKGDVLEIRVVALKTTVSQSWERASRLKISNIKEVYTVEKFDREVLCTSPYSVIE